MPERDVLTPELHRNQTSYAPEDCALKRIKIPEVWREVQRYLGISVGGSPGNKGRAWQHLVPGRHLAAPRCARLMEKAYSLLTAPLPDDPDPEAWAPLYALYYAPDTVALLHLSRHGLSCALEAALSGAGLSFELRTAQVLIDGQDHPRRPEPIRRAVALADPAARREALEIAARHLTGAPRSLAVTIGWYFPPEHGDSAVRRWMEAPDMEMHIPYACVQDAALARHLVLNRAGWRSFADIVRKFYGEALPWLLEIEQKPANEFDLNHIAQGLAAYDTEEVGRIFAGRLSRQQYRKVAVDWFMRNPELARRCLPPAIAAKGRSGPIAAELLALIERSAASHAPPQEIAEAPPEAWPEVLRDPPWQKPKAKKPPKLPKIWRSEAFTRPVFSAGAHSGQPLPLPAMAVLGEWLISTPLSRDASGLRAIREAFTPESLAALAWDALRAWELDRCKHGSRAMAHGLFFFATPELIERLPIRNADPYIHTVLSGEGSPAAARALLRTLDLPEEGAFITGQLHDQLLLCAEAPGVGTIGELLEELIPAEDARADGTVPFAYGSRTLRVGFDGYLLPQIVDEEGNRRESLPPRRHGDDPARADAARRHWACRKEEVSILARRLLQRLEEAMLLQEPWSLARFTRIWWQHPVLNGLAQRLVWSWEAPGAPGGAFRVTEDRSLADADDAPVRLPDGATIRLAHPALLPPAACARWSQILSDYTIIQPFPQIDRPCPRRALPAAKGLTVALRPDTLDGHAAHLQQRGWSLLDYHSRHRFHFQRRGLCAWFWNSRQGVIELENTAIIQRLRLDWKQDNADHERTDLSRILFAEILASLPLSPEPP